MKENQKNVLAKRVDIVSVKLVRAKRMDYKNRRVGHFKMLESYRVNHQMIVSNRYY